MKKLLVSLVAVLAIAGCNSDGGGSKTKNDLELTSQNAQSMAVYADMGRSLSIAAVDLANAHAGRSTHSQAKDVSVRNTDCYSYSQTGDTTSGSVTITYNDCGWSGGDDSFSIDGAMTVSWSGNSYTLSGNYAISGSADGTSFSITMDPLELTVVESGGVLTTTIEMTFTYDANGQSGQFNIATIEDLTAPTSSPSYVNGKLSISDGTHTFTITYVDGNATVQ